ncbi:MAG: hypothetical protein L6247_01610 [Desulfobacteraceae bacterium]|nr:hypothetical protein [Pseudomonadota bacterium]MCG2754263.1 hypothetical protein [Desulfobacteraceae bacterium]
MVCYIMLKYYKIFSVKIFPAIIVIILCLGCRAFEPVERLKESYDPYHGGQYKAALTNWSREARIYRGLDVELIATATFKSSKFRDAYSNEYARAYKLTGSEKTKVLKDQKNAVLAYNDFLLAAYVPDKKLNDFHKKDSIWKIYLTAGKGGLTAPLEIRKIKKVDAVTTHFFPYITPWKSVYLVRFPAISPAAGKALIDGDAENIKLIITSVLGSAEMVWE